MNTIGLLYTKNKEGEIRAWKYIQSADMDATDKKNILEPDRTFFVSLVGVQETYVYTKLGDFYGWRR